VKCFDVIIVGGGINGAAIARDAALRGLKSLLLERDDFASGASGKNGRMIHGGLRYLEQGEVRLVREALAERRNLLRMAPHLVKRRDLLIPIRANIGRPAWMVRLGLFTLDILCGQPSIRHRYLDRAETLRRVPSFNPDGLKGAALMFDAFAQYAERLTIENVVAAAASGATVLNHTAATQLLIEAGRVTGVIMRDANGHEQTAQAPIVVNATGAWGDEFLSQATGSSPGLLSPAKGTFIIVAPFDGAPESSVYFEARADRRPIIVTPWNGLYLVGTTDERIAHPVDVAAASHQEVDYLLDELTHCFPNVGRRIENVLYTYTGVRPLPRASGASHKVPRSHVVHNHAPQIRGMVTVLGGKLSTFRSLAQEVVDGIFKMLNRRSPPCKTAEIALPGGLAVDNRHLHSSAIGPKSLHRLTDIYGSRSTLVLALVEQDARLGAVIDDESKAIAAEVIFVARDEWASTFEDILVRRTLIGRNSQLGLNALDATARLMTSHLGWSPDRIAKSRAAYLRYVERSRAFMQKPEHPALAAASMGIR